MGDLVEKNPQFPRTPQFPLQALLCDRDASPRSHKHGWDSAINNVIICRSMRTRLVYVKVFQNGLFVCLHVLHLYDSCDRIFHTELRIQPPANVVKLLFRVDSLALSLSDDK